MEEGPVCLVIYPRSSASLPFRSTQHTRPHPRDADPQEKLLLIPGACGLIEFVFVHFIFVLTKSGLGGIYMEETYLKNTDDH